LVQGSVFAKRLRRDKRGGAGFNTAGIHQYFEDFKRSTNKDVAPKDNFEKASNVYLIHHRGRFSKPPFFLLFLTFFRAIDISKI